MAGVRARSGSDRRVAAVATGSAPATVGFPWLRTLTVLLMAALTAYGLQATEAEPAHAAVPAPAASNPTTTNRNVKSCNLIKDQNGTGWCFSNGVPANILDPRIPIDSGDVAGVGLLREDGEEFFRVMLGLTGGDHRIKQYARNQVAGLMYTRMQTIIGTPDAERSEAEKSAYRWFQKLVKAYKVQSAKNAKQEYENWKLYQCAYEPAVSEEAFSSGEVSAYEPGPGCAMLDEAGIAVNPVALATGAKPPKVEQLQAWGSWQATQQFTAPRTTITGWGGGLETGIMFGAAAVGTIASKKLLSDGFKTKLSTVYKSRAKLFTKITKDVGKPVANVLIRLLGSIGGAIAAPLFAVLMIVLAVVTLITAIVQQVQYSEIPKKLDDELNKAEQDPNLKDMLADTKNGGATLLQSIFNAQTRPETGSTPMSSSRPNHHGDLLHTQSADTSVSPPVLTGPVVTSTALSVKSWGNAWDKAILATSAGATGATPPPTTWLTDQGWYQQSIDGGASWTTESVLHYLDWGGKKRAALVQGDHFLDLPGETFDDASPPPEACEDDTTCKVTPTLQMLDANGTPVSVTFDPVLPVPSVINDNSGGTYTTGQATTFTNPEVDRRGGPVTYTWEFESRCPALGVCSKRIVADNPNDPFHLKPVVTLTGQSVAYTWPGPGSYHMRLTTTNAANEPQVAERDIVVAPGSGPSITFADRNMGPIFPGGSVEFTGCLATSTKSSKPTVSVNWDDGAIDSGKPSDFEIFVNGQVQPPTGPVVVRAGGIPPREDGSGGCQGTWSFSARHTYPASVGSFERSVYVTGEDGAGGTTAAAHAGTVTFHPKDLDVTSFGFTNNPETYQGRPVFDVGQPAPFYVTFNAPPAIYGSNLTIDWGQFGEQTAFLTQHCTAGGCEQFTRFESNHVFFSRPGANGISIYPITLLIHDNAGNTTQQLTTEVAIRSAAPSLSGLTLTPSSPVSQGQEVTFTGTVRSLDPTTPLAVDVDWPGDDEHSKINLPPSRDPQSFSVKHVLRGIGNDFIRVKVVDQAGGGDNTFHTFPVTINNVAPQPTTEPVAGDQGAPVALNVARNDPGRDNTVLTVNWGDGSTTNTFFPGGGGDILTTPEHRYANPGTYNVTVSVNDGNGDGGPVPSTTTTMTIDNVRPAVSLNAGGGDRRRPITLTGTITDPGSQGSFTGTVDWRDETPTETFTLPAGTTGFSLTHTYDQGGLFPVVVSVTDNHGAQSDEASAVLTANGPPSFRANKPPNGRVGVRMEYQFAAQGYPSPTIHPFDGTLPPGLTMSSDGMLSGRPTQTGSFTFRVRAFNFGANPTPGGPVQFLQEQVTGPITIEVGVSADGDYETADGDTDVAVFRRGSGVWFVNGGATLQWGTDGDIPVPGDYDGDGDSDPAVYRPSNSHWFVRGGETTHWGTDGDIPVPGDYDGDGDADPAVYRPSSGLWFVRGGPTVHWGTQGDVPVPGDYDGDGDTDFAVYRPATGYWFVQGGETVHWGTTGDVPVPGDYDGDRHTDVAVYRPSSGLWFVYNGDTVHWGTGDDIPVPGDYDGDGDADPAVFRRGSGEGAGALWLVKGEFTVAWGISSDIPLPLPSAIRQTYFP